MRFRLQWHKFTAKETWELAVDRGGVGEDVNLTSRWRKNLPEKEIWSFQNLGVTSKFDLCFSIMPHYSYNVS
jgi:hypothetical protein